MLTEWLMVLRSCKNRLYKIKHWCGSKKYSQNRSRHEPKDWMWRRHDTSCENARKAPTPEWGQKTANKEGLISLKWETPETHEQQVSVGGAGPETGRRSWKVKAHISHVFSCLFMVYPKVVIIKKSYTLKNNNNNILGLAPVKVEVHFIATKKFIS